jgi:hypothetical protein
MLRRLGVLCCIGLLVGCAKKNDEANVAADTAAMAPAPPPPPAVTLNDFAGMWDMKAIKEGTDSVLLAYELTATADSNNWKMKFPGRATPETAHVLAVGGDSVVVHAGPYPSALRKGVQVTTHGVYHLQNGMLMGTTVARYNVKTADSVLNIRTEGTKKQ